MKIEFSTDNDMFVGIYEDDPISQEIYKRIQIEYILSSISKKIIKDGRCDGGPIMDINGNKIGEWSL